MSDESEQKPNDIVQRLRGFYWCGPGQPLRDFGQFVPPISLEAATEIERLRAENERMRLVLDKLCAEIEADEQHGAEAYDDECEICNAIAEARALVPVNGSDKEPTT